MTDDAAVFLVNAWQKPWNIFKGDYGDIESVAEAYESCCFD